MLWVLPAPYQRYTWWCFLSSGSASFVDTGCERSVVGSALLKDAVVVPMTMTLAAANGAAIALLGETHTTLSVGTDVLPAHLLVTDQLADLILGIDWLWANHCNWHFTNSVLTLRGRNHQLGIYDPDGTKSTRHFVLRDVTVPGNHMGTVPAFLARPRQQGC